MIRTPHADAHNVILITACSGLFYDHYADLLDSIDAVGLNGQFDVGLIDLGMSEAQLAALRERGVRIVPPHWPIEPPPNQQATHLLAFAAKPFAKDFFPGYETYVWMDADMWVQTADFWPALVEGARASGCAVPIEADPAYSAMAWRHQLWMVRHFLNSYGPFRALQLYLQPMINNGVFALQADAPHWQVWQKHFERMVSRTERTLAIDQLALMAAKLLEGPDLTLIDTRYNWVCSLGTPMYDLQREQFVKPGQPGNRSASRSASNSASDVISVMHITTPARGRQFPVLQSDGTVVQRYLHFPGGRIIDQLKRESAGQSALHLPA